MTYASEAFSNLVSATMFEHADCTPDGCIWRELAEESVAPADLMGASELVTTARQRFSEAFLLHKNRDPRKPLTDREAEHRAYIECGAERDMAEARLEVARARLLNP